MNQMKKMTPMKVQLAKEFQKAMNGHKKDTSEFKIPPLNWYMSEKFDGYRALFKYEMINDELVGVFYSRTGKRFMCPQWFLDSMPPPDLLGDNILDGELWAGRDNFQLMGVVRKKVPIDEEWIDIQYHVYDITTIEDTFIERLKKLKFIVSFCDKRWNILKKRNEIQDPFHNIDCPLCFTEQKKITSLQQMDKYYQKIIENGGEGIMIKHPTQSYENGRSSYMLKYKPSFDKEAIIIDYKFGKGKYENKLGSFICKPLINHDTFMTIDDDKEHIFTLSGMDDSIRKNYQKTHPIGTIITFEYSGMTDKGVPRFGRYIRKRTDIILNELNDSDIKIKRIKFIFHELEKHWRNNYDSFRVKSYSNANKSLKNVTKDSELTEENLDQLKGIGKGLKEKIRLIIDTNTCPDYEKILNNTKNNSSKESFLKIHGVGPTCATKLIQNGFKTIDDLRNCKEIDKYLNDVQKKGLHYYDDILERIPNQEIKLHETYLKKMLTSIDKNAELTIAGSYRRQKETSGDIDLLIKAKDKAVYMSFINRLIDDKYLIETLAHGPKKFMGMGTINQEKNRRIDIMYTKPEEYPFAILYFTGSADFNVTMRNNLLEKGYTINEYSVKHTDTKKKVDHKFITEKDIFDYFEFEYLDPENR
jgi:DNA polymerase/3'-5' exonuclease PolX